MPSQRVQRKPTEQTRDTKRASDLAVRAPQELVPGSGQPLDSSVRDRFEPGFGHDFGSVRVHTDQRAADSADALDAQAFTTGSDIVFGAGAYDPASVAGQELIAHELAHVVQQGGGQAPIAPQARALDISAPDDPLERAADNAAAAVLTDPIASPFDSWFAPGSPSPADGKAAGGESYTTVTPLILRRASSSDEDEEDRLRLQAQLLVMLGEESGDTAVTEEIAPAEAIAPVEAAEETLAPEAQIADEADEVAETVAAPADMVEVAPEPLAAPPEIAEAAETAETAEDQVVEAGTAESAEAQVADIAEAAPVEAPAAPPPPAAGTAPPAAPGSPADQAAPVEGTAPPAAASTPADQAAPVEGTAPPAAASTPADQAGGGAPPASPEGDPAFGAVVGAVGGAAEAQSAHAPAGAKAGEASAAATMPAAERSGSARGGQVGAMASATEAGAAAASGDSVPGFDKEAFKAAIRQRIQGLTPSDPKEMENFGSSNNLDEVRGEVGGQVESGKATAQGGVPAATAAAPDEGAVPERPTTPLQPNEPGPSPAEIDATGAAPKPRGADQLESPLAEESARLDSQLAENQVTEQQLAESNEPEFQSALGMKRESQAAAAVAPGDYRADEQEQIAGAQTEASAQVAAGSADMAAERAGLFGQVDQDQQTAQAGDEAKRVEIGQQISAIYEETKTAVEARLQKLDGDVNAAFEAGAARAKDAFSAYVERETAAYKRERYNEEGGLLDQIGGEATRLWDNLTDMPEEYYTIYADGRELYIVEMDVALDTIADIVGAGLTEAREIVRSGRERIAEFVASQPAELRGVAEQAAGDIQGRFDELERSVDSRRDQLVESLSQRYSDNLAALDAEIAAVREANKGPLQRAYEATAGVLEKINQLKDLLLGALGGAMDAVMSIIAAPIEFIGNLIDGVGQGLSNFVGNIATHLQTGFIEWLTGTLGGAGIQVPETLDMEGVLDLALQVLGLTWANIRQRAVAIFGEGVVSALETGFELFVILLNEGLPGVWEWIQDKLSGIYDQVIDGIKEMLVVEVIEAGVRWLIGLLGGPAGAFIKACMMVYDIIMWFINNAQRIADLIRAVSEAARAIAAGNLSGAAEFVEQALARAIPTAIGFLAGLVGLGDLSTKVRKIIERIQAPINEAIDWLLNLVKGFVQKIARALGLGGEENAEAGDGEIGKEVPFSAEGESHKLYVDAQGSQATLMVASTPMTVEERLADWETRLADMPDEQKSQAQSLIGQARGMLTSADSSADELARKKDAVKKLEDGDAIAAADTALEQQEQSLAGVLGQLFTLFGEEGQLPEGELVNLPFAIAGESHTLSVDHTSGEIIVWMASMKERVEARYSSVRQVLDDYEEYLKSTDDEELKAEIRSALELVQTSMNAQIPGFVERLTEAKSPARPGILEEIRASAQQLIGEIETYAQAFFPDLTPVAVRKILDDRIEAAWEKVWRAKQQQVLDALEQFVPQVEALGQNTSMKVRGSLAKGIKHDLSPTGEVLKFDPEDFDVDVYIVSDDVIRRSLEEGEATPRGSRRPGVEIVGSQSGIREIEKLVRDMRAVVSRITGVRDTGENAWRFNIFLRSVENEAAVIEEDRQHVQDAGLDESRAEPLTVTSRS